MANQNNIKVIHNLCEFLEVAKHLQSNHTDEMIFYRGQADEKWGLLPSIARANEELRKAESIMINEVILNKPEEFIDMKEFDILAKLQHYGLPTRLLDVTENPLIALYFACNSNFEANGSIYYVKKVESDILDSNHIMANLISSLAITSGKWTGGFALEMFLKDIHITRPRLANDLTNLINFISKDDDAIDIIYDFLCKGHVFVLPRKTNERIVRQTGAFILFSNLAEAVVYEKHWFNNDILDIKDNILNSMEYRIIVDKDNKREILKELNSIGISQGYLFPELSDICRNVSSKYRDYKKDFIM